MANTGELAPLAITQYYQTKNRCYKAGKIITPTGIVVHSTGANNPYLKRWVGPDDGILGKNKYGNHWNNILATKCMHGWVGKVADGSLAIYQTLPWNYRCWGVGKGKKGSYNDSHIQFEICEDSKTDEAYYREAFALAVRFCAYLCQEYGIKVENIVGHYEAHDAGYGSNHGDPRKWQIKHGGSMAAFRAEVADLLGQEIAAEVTTSAAQHGTDQGGVSMPTIRKGDKGTAVKVLQRMLLAAGCTLPKYGADGSCGAETVAAVKAFQTTHNLTVDGKCGPLTWAALAAG